MSLNTRKSQGGAVLLETFLFDFDADLYGETCRVSFFGFLRPELKFDGLEALTAFVDHRPLWQVHQAVFAVLALESEPGLAEAVVLAGIRELWEEAGLRLALPAPDPLPALPPGWQDFSAGGFRPHTEAMRFVFRAITPPGRSRRGRRSASARRSPGRISRPSRRWSGRPCRSGAATRPSTTSRRRPRGSPPC